LTDIQIVIPAKAEIQIGDAPKHTDAGAKLE